MMGYLVDFMCKSSIFFRNKPGDNYTEKRTALMKRDTLEQMVRSGSSYLVLQAVLVNMDDYRINHPEEELKIIESL